jgi:D-alanyl-D-alanine carboxypeptidase
VSAHTQPFSERARRPSRWALVGIAALLVAAGLAIAIDLAFFSGGSPPQRPELQRILDGLVTGPGRIAPGATAYVSGPHGTWQGSAGTADVRTGEPMRSDARMRLESVSKIHTAALIALLDQEGKLSMSDTVARWFPGLLPRGDEITIRQLLTMRSGLIDMNDLVARPEHYLSYVHDPGLRNRMIALAKRVDANPAYDVSPTFWIKWAAWVPLLFQPGAGSHYSSIGYEVLGLIAARAAGKPLPELYRTRIFEPLGLDRSAYDPRGAISGRHAHGYQLAAGKGPFEATDAHTAIGAGGGVVSDAEDTAAFLTAVMKGRLVSNGEAAALRGANLWQGGEESGCAGRAYGWSGAGPAFKTNAWVDGSGSRVAVLLLNGRVVDSGQSLADGTAGAALARLYCAA